MPKEITHWLIAEAVMERYHSKENSEKPITTLTSTLTATPTTQTLPAFDHDLVLLGASFHDVMYYVPKHPSAPAYTALADYLHGSRGEDTWEPLRLLAKDYLRHDDASHRADIRSFMLGMVTHICADIAFHPYIYWAAGNWHGKGLFAAQRKHRLLEGAIDLYLLQKSTAEARKNSPPTPAKLDPNSPAEPSESTPPMALLRRFNLKTMLLHRRKRLTHVARGIARHSYWKVWRHLGTKTLTYAIVSGFQRLAVARWWCERPWANRIVRRLEPRLSPRLQSLTALRYAEESLVELTTQLAEAERAGSVRTNSTSLTSTQAPILYFTHTVTGNPSQTSITAMFEQAVQDSVRWWQMIDEALLLEKMPLLLDYGASLEVSLPKQPAATMVFFKP
jgi:hypothetical protein